MKVVGVEPYMVYPGSYKNWVFVRIDTDEGLHGWGEAYTQLGRERTVVHYIEQMGRYLEGRDPHHIRQFCGVVQDDLGGRRPSMEFSSALSGIELALWDLLGKRTDTPVYNLLGGAVRPRVRVYANGWSNRSYDRRPEDVAEKAVEQVDAGFTALKFDPFEEPVRTFIDRPKVELAVETVRQVRAAVGPDVDLMIEVHRRLAPSTALHIAREIESYRPYWYEEPVPPGNLAGLAEVRAGTTMPIVAGEALYGLTDFLPLFEIRGADIINPDVCNTGGILELMEIAAAARAHLVAVAPHNYNSTTVGLAASLHCALAIQNFAILEYFVNWRDAGLNVCPSAPVPEGGHLPAPTAPGLGIDLDLDALTLLDAEDFIEKRLLTAAEEKPGV